MLSLCYYYINLTCGHSRLQNHRIIIKDKRYTPGLLKKCSSALLLLVADIPSFWLHRTKAQEPWLFGAQPIFNWFFHRQFVFPQSTASTALRLSNGLGYGILWIMLSFHTLSFAAELNNGQQLSTSTMLIVVTTSGQNVEQATHINAKS